jgi:hypothetical protein
VGAGIIGGDMHILFAMLIICVGLLHAEEKESKEAKELREWKESIKVWEEGKPDVICSVNAYLAAFSNQEETVKWNKKLDERIIDSKREVADIALDWFFDCEEKLKQQDPKKVREACFWFLRFISDDIPPPLQMRSRMTKENFDTLVNWLDTEVKKKGKKQ